MKYNSCTKDMTLHVLVNKVLKLNTQPLRNDFLGQKNSLSKQAVYSPCFSHGFPDCSAKLNRPPLIESMEPRFSLKKLLGMSGPTDVCSRIQPFWPLYRVCNKTYLHTFLPSSKLKDTSKRIIGWWLVQPLWPLHKVCIKLKFAYTCKLICLELPAEEVFFLSILILFQKCVYWLMKKFSRS